MLPHALDCPFFIVPSLFSNVYLLDITVIVDEYIKGTVLVKETYLAL